MAELIKVRAARDDGRVVLYEVHPDHPNGEAWVSGNGRVVEVAETPTVLRKLASGELVKVEDPKPAKASKAKAEGETKAESGNDSKSE